MTALCIKDYDGTMTLYRACNTKKHHPIHLIKGQQYDVLPTLGGYIIGYTKDVAFFRDEKWFNEYFSFSSLYEPFEGTEDMTQEETEATLDGQAIYGDAPTSDEIFSEDTEDHQAELFEIWREFFSINDRAICRLIELGVLKTTKHSCRDAHVGKSDYSEHVIQPWTIWLEYNMNAWDADIQKRLLRTKVEPGMTPEEARKLDYQKIIHDAQERIRQLDVIINNSPELSSINPAI